MEKPETWQALIAGMTPEIHQSLKTAVELGKWPNGDRLTREQLDHCMQAVIAYDQRFLPEEQRTAYIAREGLKKVHCDD